MAIPTFTDRIVILGCGCFGASTAYHLLQRGYSDVTILDKSSTVPAPDAASNDINRIVRSSYADRFYAELAREAITAWKKEEDWNDTYHESGVVVLGLSPNDPEQPIGIPASVPSSEIPYAKAAFLNDLELEARVFPLGSSEAFASAFPSSVRLTSFDGKFGYLNKDGGWAHARQGLSLLIEKVRGLGGKVIAGKEVKSIAADHGKCKSVVCDDGSKYDADFIIAATGSWTASAFPGLNLQDAFLATGQCVAMMQLTPEEAQRYRDCPVILEFDTGFYVFPPNADHIMKMAIHGPGFTHTVGNISTPRTVVSHPIDGLAIPTAQATAMRDCLNKIYPEFQDREFSATRLCWYNDSPDGEWVISNYPGIEGLVLATAGSGHAYKFLPVIGRIVADLLEQKLSETIVAKLAYGRSIAQQDTSRTGVPQELDVNKLWTPRTKKQD